MAPESENNLRLQIALDPVWNSPRQGPRLQKPLAEGEAAQARTKP